jgi:hypothetical protein
MRKLTLMKQNKLIDYTSKTIYIFCLIFIFFVFYDNKEHVVTLSENISLKVIFILISIGILRSYLESNVLFLFSKKFCKKINFFDFLSIYLKTALTNHAIPHYGTIYRSFLLKKKGLNHIDYIFCLTLFKLLKILFSFLFVVILFLVFLREYLNIDNDFFLILNFFIGSFFILITLFIVIQLFKKNKKIFELMKYIKKSFNKQINLNILIYISLIILIEFLIFYLVFESISMQTFNLLLIIYIFRIITAHIPIIQINTVHIVLLTIFSSVAGLNFVDGFLINLSATLVGIISLIVSILIQNFFIFINLYLRNNHG